MAFVLSLLTKPSIADKITLAVMYVESKSGGGEQIILENEVRYWFSVHESLDVLSREEMESRIPGQPISLMSSSDLKDVIYAGKALKVRKIVTDIITKRDNQFAVQLKVVDVDHAKVECTEQKESADFNGLVRSIRDVVGKLAWRLRVNRAREIVQERIDDAQAHFNLADMLMVGWYHSKGANKEAEREYREAIRLRPDWVDPHYTLATVLEARKNYGEAEKEYDLAIRCKPNDFHAYYRWGGLLLQLRKYAEAEKIYRDITFPKPDDAFAHSGLATALVRQYKFKEGEAEYREAIRLDPNWIESRLTFASHLVDRNKYEEAEEQYRAVVRLRPFDCENHLYLGNSLLKQGKYKDAELSYQKAIRLYPNFSSAFVGLGQTLLEQGKEEESEKAFREAIRIHGNDYEALTNLAQLLDKQGRRKEAREYWKRALKLERRPEQTSRIKDRLVEPD